MRKLNAHARVPISQLVSDPLPFPNLASSFSHFSNVISNGGFYVLKVVMKDDPLAAKTQPFKDKVEAQNR